MIKDKFKGIRAVKYYLAVMNESRLPVKRYLIILVATGLMMPLVNILLPRFFISALMGELGVGGESVLTQSLVVLVTFFVVGGVAQIGSKFVSQQVMAYMPVINYKLSAKLQKVTMEMDFELTEDKKILDKVVSANVAMSWTMGVFLFSGQIIASSILLVIYGVLISLLEPLMFAFLLIISILSYYTLLKAKIYDTSLREERAHTDRKRNYLQQTMFDYTYAKEIRLFGLYDMISARYKVQRDMKEELHKKSQKKVIQYGFNNHLINGVSQAVIYFILIYLFFDGRLGVDEFVMYMAMAVSFGVISSGLTDDVARMVELERYISDYEDITSLELNQDKSNQIVLDSPLSDDFTITFKGVSFSYPTNARLILDDISFTLQAGKHTSLVGLNGSGKSTIVKLICRLYKPTSGEILINGVNIESYTKESYYKYITTVFEDSKLYALTVQENIILDAEEDKDRVAEILKDLGLFEKIADLPHKENSQVLKHLYEEAVEFSGGEAQRLAIARAMYKGGSVLLLDEPTAALDALAEQRIYEGFSEISKGKTTLFISHRLNANRFCDQVLMMADGKIVDEGTHEELLDRCTMYKELYELQASYYVEGTEVTV